MSVYESIIPVYVIVLNYNGWRDTIDCLQSLCKLNSKDVRLVVVDNCSTDDSWERLVDWASNTNDLPKYNSTLGQVGRFSYVYILNEIEIDIEVSSKLHEEHSLTLIRASKNRGYSAGNNIGIKYGMLRSDKAYFWILNNDTEVTENSLNELLKCHQYYSSEDKVGIIGGKILYFDEPDIVQCLGGATYDPYLGTVKQLNNGQHSNEVFYEGKPVDYICGACMLVTSDFIREVGLLSEDFFLYYEEIDWCIRGKKMGWNLAYTDTCIIFHKEGATTGSNRKHKSKIVDYYSIRNRIIILKKYYSRKHLIVFYIVLIITALNQLLKGNTFRISNLWKLTIKT